MPSSSGVVVDRGLSGIGQKLAGWPAIGATFKKTYWKHGRLRVHRLMGEVREGRSLPRQTGVDMPPQARLPARLEHRLRDRGSWRPSQRDRGRNPQTHRSAKLETPGWHRLGLTDPDHSQRLIFPRAASYSTGADPLIHKGIGPLVCAMRTYASCMPSCCHGRNGILTATRKISRRQRLANP
jgi:hypothetical protein